MKKILRQLQARTDFNFNGRWLSEFNATLYNTGGSAEINVLSNYSHTTQEISNVGKKYTGKTLEPRVEKLNICFKGEVDIDEFIDWIDTEEPKPFYYPNEDRQIMCILNSDISLEAYFNSNFTGLLEIEMIAYIPYWTEFEYQKRYLEIDNPVRGQEYGIYYDGNVASHPIIRLECVGEKTNIAIGFNNYEIEIDRFTQNINIDMRYGKIWTELEGKEINKYSSYKLIGGFYEREMIKTIPKSHNTFRLIRGDINKIKITPNIMWK